MQKSSAASICPTRMVPGCSEIACEPISGSGKAHGASCPRVNYHLTFDLDALGWNMNDCLTRKQGSLRRFGEC